MKCSSKQRDVEMLHMIHTLWWKIAIRFIQYSGAKMRVEKLEFGWGRGCSYTASLVISASSRSTMLNHSPQENNKENRSALEE
jgi:hypothetical protein